MCTTCLICPEQLDLSIPIWFDETKVLMPKTRSALGDKTATRYHRLQLLAAQPLSVSQKFWAPPLG